MRRTLWLIPVVLGILLLSGLLGCAAPKKTPPPLASTLTPTPTPTATLNAGIQFWMEQRHVTSYEGIDKFVTAGDPEVRKAALSIVAEVPETIKADAQSWKIWIISYWVANNILYVTDPLGQEFVAYPRETLEAKAGDCEDMVVLLESLYESVGLDTAFVWVDTDEDGEADHAAALVYYPGDADEFLKDERFIMEKLGLKPLEGRRYIRYYEAPELEGTIRSYPWGIWIFVDPLSPGMKELAGNILSDPYEAVQVVDVGYK